MLVVSEERLHRVQPVSAQLNWNRSASSISRSGYAVCARPPRRLALPAAPRRNHSIKVALRLGRHGSLTTERGRSGGIALARKTQDINLGDVVRQIEDDFELAECMRPEGGNCLISPACRLKEVVRKAVGAFLSASDDCLLAYIGGKWDVVAELLGLPSKTAESGMIELQRAS